jgi:ABC-type phosphate/phosphonate transport system substrate-binding protein
VEAGDAANLGNQLADDKVQLGVFHGFEFAWARQKHPELKPLIIALTPPSCARAHLMVRKNAGYKALADLKGKTLAMPQRTREHCHLFIERRCQDAGDSPAKFFAQLTTPADFEDALDGVVDGTVQATLVDGAALDTYAQRKPGRAARLSTLIESETFPPAVVACNPSNLDEATQRRFRDGMINSAQTRKGQQLLTICRITGFDRTPDGYDRDLQTILKAYPPTAAK